MKLLVLIIKEIKEKKDPLTSLNPGLFMRGNGLEILEMGLEYRPGPMELNTKENGKIIKLMEKVSFGMLMVIFLKEIGEMIKLMGKEFIFM